jgi:photosystem II stability/assembly factor-like uncharacterized protein/pimeloyl-ACP methyl ester carboxylesterase
MNHIHPAPSLFRMNAALLLVLFCASASYAQWESQTSGTTVRLRGVSAVNQSIAWASGDKGTYARTLDGGRTWTPGHVPGSEELDFRDVDAFSADTAYLLSIGEGEKSRIYKTTDGGLHWTLQFKNSRPAAFFDAMAFWDATHGIAVSDPVDGRFLIITTSDGGATWKGMPGSGMPPALQGEGAFAASGTCIAVEGKRNVWFGTGGPNGARIFRSSDGGRSWKVATTPMTGGKAAGIFSVVFSDAHHGVIVGGDYEKEREVGNNAAWTSDGGKTWRLAEAKRPNGYRSGVALSLGAGNERSLVAVGPSGSDSSTDGGKSWSMTGEEGFHSVSFAKDASAGWAVGENGRIAKYKGQSVTMKNGLWSLLSGGLASLNPIGQSQGATAEIERRTVQVGDKDYNFQVYIPAALAGQKALPLIVFLHGIGQRGAGGVIPTAGAGGTIARHYLEQVPAIILVPQCRQGSYWTDPEMTQMVMQALEQTVREFKADPARVYLTGVSMGGYGVWHIASEHPRQFAALVAICGGSPLREGERFSAIAQEVGQTPTWVFHGADDRVVPVTESREMVKAMQANHAPVRYSEYAGVGHNVWMKALAEKELLPWLLAQHLDNGQRP